MTHEQEPKALLNAIEDLTKAFEGFKEACNKQFDDVRRTLSVLEQRNQELEASRQHLDEALRKGFKDFQKENDDVKERLSLYMDHVAFLRIQLAGAATPKPVERVAGGYGMVEPRSTWRRGRYGR